ncbi:MAG: transposase [Bacillota bacterium]
MCELITAEGFAYGYLKLTHCLRRKFHLIINKKKVYRRCQGTGYLKAAAEDKAQTPPPAYQEPGHYGFQPALGNRY